MVEFFRTNRGMDLERITTATLSKLEEIKERTATGTLEALSLTGKLYYWFMPTKSHSDVQVGWSKKSLFISCVLSSVLGLTHIIETRKVLDLRVNLKPSYLVVPQTGFHHEKSDFLVLDFGTFQVFFPFCPLSFELLDFH